ncbi:UNVERIFIED_CONTAM: hypothetical protein HHA_293425 [Hammondia hammondi]|eukprot:XP_008884726.1 hypothetical protein HHA_293425 [Hammondia hammondi]
MLLIGEIFFETAGRRLIPQAYKATEAINILAALPVPLIGFLADRRGITASMCVVNVIELLALIFTIIPEFPTIGACQYLASSFMAVASPFLVTQIYCYVLQSFQEAHSGKLVGLACFIVGVPMVAVLSMVKDGFNRGFFDMLLACILMLAVSLLLLGVIVILRLRRATTVLSSIHPEGPLHE